MWDCGRVLSKVRRVVGAGSKGGKVVDMFEVEGGLVWRVVAASLPVGLRFAIVVVGVQSRTIVGLEFVQLKLAADGGGNGPCVDRQTHGVATLNSRLPHEES